MMQRKDDRESSSENGDYLDGNDARVSDRYVRVYASAFIEKFK